jgi:uncharacterized protein
MHMTPDERQLIMGLFDRMRGYALAEKDGEAETLISQQVSGLRDAPYMLVQSVLVQEHALQQADARIKELEEQVRQLESEARGQPAAGSGSFLGGLFGGRPAAEPPRGPTSVPAIGSRATPSVYDSRQDWTPQGPGQPQPGGPFGQAGQQPGGGFLRSAMTTAAGVAGGMLVAGAISNMLGSHGAHASTPAATTPAAADSKADSKDTAQSQDDAYQDGYQDAVDESGGGWGDDGGGDFDI